MFKDRINAGGQLSSLLPAYKQDEAVVFAMPRGGVVLGFQIAQIHKWPLELVITRKIGHPENPEYAIGAVGETGRFLLNKQEKFIDQKWLENEIKKEQIEAIRRRNVYYGDRKEEKVKDKTVILVDDGVATGLSLSLAIEELKAKKPKEIIVVVPVISEDIADSIGEICDKLIAIKTVKGYFGSVGNYYENFPQMSDEEVVKLLSIIWTRK